jgi:hypothetical protein
MKCSKRTQRPTCAGTGKLPRIVIQNDWYIGEASTSRTASSFGGAIKAKLL